MWFVHVPFTTVHILLYSAYYLACKTITLLYQRSKVKALLSYIAYILARKKVLGYCMPIAKRPSTYVTLIHLLHVLTGQKSVIIDSDISTMPAKAFKGTQLCNNIAKVGSPNLQWLQKGMYSKKSVGLLAGVLI